MSILHEAYLHHIVQDFFRGTPMKVTEKSDDPLLHEVRRYIQKYYATIHSIIYTGTLHKPQKEPLPSFEVLYTKDFTFRVFVNICVDNYETIGAFLLDLLRDYHEYRKNIVRKTRTVEMFNDKRSMTPLGVLKHLRCIKDGGECAEFRILVPEEPDQQLTNMVLIGGQAGMKNVSKGDFGQTLEEYKVNMGNNHKIRNALQAVVLKDNAQAENFADHSLTKFGFAYMKYKAMQMQQLLSHLVQVQANVEAAATEQAKIAVIEQEMNDSYSLLAHLLGIVNRLRTQPVRRPQDALSVATELQSVTDEIQKLERTFAILQKLLQEIKNRPAAATGTASELQTKIQELEAQVARLKTAGANESGEVSEQQLIVNYEKLINTQEVEKMMYFQEGLKNSTLTKDIGEILFEYLFLKDLPSLRGFVLPPAIDAGAYQQQKRYGQIISDEDRKKYAANLFIYLNENIQKLLSLEKERKVNERMTPGELKEAVTQLKDALKAREEAIKGMTPEQVVEADKAHKARKEADEARKEAEKKAHEEAVKLMTPAQRKEVREEADNKLKEEIKSRIKETLIKIVSSPKSTLKLDDANLPWDPAGWTPPVPKPLIINRRGGGQTVITQKAATLALQLPDVQVFMVSRLKNFEQNIFKAAVSDITTTYRYRAGNTITTSLHITSRISPPVDTASFFGFNEGKKDELSRKLIEHVDAFEEMLRYILENRLQGKYEQYKVSQTFYRMIMYHEVYSEFVNRLKRNMQLFEQFFASLNEFNRIKTVSTFLFNVQFRQFVDDMKAKSGQTTLQGLVEYFKNSENARNFVSDPASLNRFTAIYRGSGSLIVKGSSAADEDLSKFSRLETWVMQDLKDFIDHESTSFDPNVMPRLTEHLQSYYGYSGTIDDFIAIFKTMMTNILKNTQRGMDTRDSSFGRRHVFKTKSKKC